MNTTTKTPTIYDIKYSITNESHYFDRQSMRFFGQTLKDFTVKKSPAGRIFIYAPIKDKYTNKLTGGYSFREYAENKLVNVPINELVTLGSILQYINTH